jgi:hypothetical protein
MVKNYHFIIQINYKHHPKPSKNQNLLQIFNLLNSKTPKTVQLTKPPIHSASKNCRNIKKQSQLVIQIRGCRWKRQSAVFPHLQILWLTIVHQALLLRVLVERRGGVGRSDNGSWLGGVWLWVRRIGVHMRCQRRVWSSRAHQRNLMRIRRGMVKVVIETQNVLHVSIGIVLEFASY